MAQAAPLVGLAATGLSAYRNLVGASTAAQGDRVEAQQAVDAAQIGQTKAYETGADMRRKLTGQLANISAIRASAGLNPPRTEGVSPEW
jgi:hypothetical protein